MGPRTPYRWAAALLALWLAGCGHDAPLQPKPDPGTIGRELPPEIRDDAQALVEANNRFTLDLYSKLRGGSGNLFFSAYSISTAFGMLSAGAAGATRDEIASTFHFTLPVERLHPAFAALQRSLDRGAQAGGYELSTANRIWGQQGFPFLQSFLDVTREDYGAEMQPVDFQGAPEAARQVINHWVEERTNGRIQDLFPSGSIDQSTRLALANAIYFKGLWEVPFDPEETHDGDFNVSPSQTVQVPIMSRFDTCRVVFTPDVSMLELGYGEGDLSMLVLLPARADGLGDLEANLSLEMLDALRASVTEEKIQLELPRFKVQSKFNLRQILSDMGVVSAFAADAADLSGIDGGRDLFVSGAFHQGFVEVNEAGTEAAAATGITVGLTSPPPSFVARHPFLFLIRDNLTGSILFMGRVVDPSA